MLRLVSSVRAVAVGPVRKSLTRSFAITPLRLNEVTTNLQSVLKAESNFEKKDAFGLDETYQNYLQESGFHPQAADNSVLTKLVRQNGLETVHVFFDVQAITQASYDLRQFQESAEDADELMDIDSPEFRALSLVDVNVVVEKDGKAVGFDMGLSLLTHELGVSGITNFDNASDALAETSEAAAKRDVAYSGPSFVNLAEELQVSLEAYLQSRGVTTELGDFILAYSSVKENNLYISWLDRLTAFF